MTDKRKYIIKTNSIVSVNENFKIIKHTDPESMLFLQRVKNMEERLDIKFKFCEFFEDYKYPTISIKKLKAYYFDQGYFDEIKTDEFGKIISDDFQAREKSNILLRKTIQKILPKVALKFEVKSMRKEQLTHHDVLLIEEFIQKSK